jgi:hypothetical protein
MTETTKSSKVGDLLVESGLLTRDELQEGMDLSASLGLPIGKTMVMLGVLGEKTIRAAVLLQSMLKDGLLQHDLAVTALVKSNQEGLPIEDCLIELGWRPLSELGNNKVGELLIDAGVLTKGDLRDVLEQVNASGFPLSRILVLTGKVTRPVVWCALNTQVLLRDNKITREQAIKAVRSTLERKVIPRADLEELMPSHRIKLGELLVLSGLVGEEEIVGAVEESVMKEMPLGQVLVQQGLIASERLADALKVQEMSDNKALTPLQAVDVLRTVQTLNHPLQRAIAELGLMKPERSESIRLGDLLKAGGFINDDEIDEAMTLAAKNSNLLGKMLVAFGFIDDAMLVNTLQCQFLVREGVINREQAITVLHLSQRTRCTIDDALVELGFTGKGSGQAEAGKSEADKSEADLSEESESEPLLSKLSKLLESGEEGLTL